MASDKALYWFGRFNVNVAPPASSWRLTRASDPCAALASFMAFLLESELTAWLSNVADRRRRGDNADRTGVTKDPAEDGYRHTACPLAHETSRHLHRPCMHNPARN